MKNKEKSLGEEHDEYVAAIRTLIRHGFEETEGDLDGRDLSEGNPNELRDEYRRLSSLLIEYLGELLPKERKEISNKFVDLTRRFLK